MLARVVFLLTVLLLGACQSGSGSRLTAEATVMPPPPSLAASGMSADEIASITSEDIPAPSDADSAALALATATQEIAAPMLAYATPGTPAVSSDPRAAGIVVDAESGRILYADNATAPRHPASLTKMMTLYILFEEMERGQLSLNSSIAISPTAARQAPTKLGLPAGSAILVQDAILAVAVKSSNDIAVAVAEAIEGSEPAFAARMTRTARRLGMRSTIYRNASGLPDAAQITTAQDIAILARALRNDFPRQYRYFSVQSFAYNGRTYKNTNQLLGEVPGMDGIKTGYVRASGYNLAASVRRDGKSLIVVVLGGSSSSARNARVAALDGGIHADPGLCLAVLSHS